MMQNFDVFFIINLNKVLNKLHEISPIQLII